MIYASIFGWISIVGALAFASFRRRQWIKLIAEAMVLTAVVELVVAYALVTHFAPKPGFLISEEEASGIAQSLSTQMFFLTGPWIFMVFFAYQRSKGFRFK